MEEQEESWSKYDPLLTKPKIALHMASVWGQSWATSEYGCCCCTAGEPIVEVVAGVVGTVVVVTDVDVAERIEVDRPELALS